MEQSRQFMCFVCSKNIKGDFHSLFFHLRTIHAITYAGNYFVCAQNGCQRTFQSVWPYKRHLIKHVLEQDSNNDTFINDVPGEVFDYNSENEDMMHSGDDVEIDGVNDFTGQSRHAELDVMSIASSFISKLKAKANLPLSTLNTVIECTSEMFSEIIEALKEKTKKVVEDLGNGMRNDDDLADLMNDFEESRRPFTGLETGWLQNKYFLNLGTFIPPVSVPLGVAFNPQPDPHSGVVLQRQKRDTFEYVPIRDLLLEVLDADLLDAIRQYKTREHEPGILEDFKDGSYYKSNPALCDPETINILLYFDELETTNPFSPKAGTHKLGLFYFTLKDVHSVHQSSLKNMFLLAVALSKDIKHYGFNAILNPIVDDLKVLESEGLLCDDGTKVRVVLGQTTGDNLGLHGMLGFAEGFTANFPCRRCSMPRDDAHTATAEDDSLIRTVETYDRDIAVDDVSRTGVKRMCPLNDLVGYHVTDNHVFDIMHDILEGVGLIEVKLVLKAIITEGVLTLDVINDRIVSFDYGFPESSNKPSVITEQSLNRSTSATGQKAEQAYFLIRHLLILIGDLVPEDTCNDHLQVIRLLLSCMDIIFAPKVSEEETYYLQRLIQEHHDHFLTTFPDNHLLPKHHHMLHYPAVIRAIGPLKHFSSMRFEGKHAFFKQVAQVTCNFKNICKTMARRHQMTLSDALMRKELFEFKPLESGKGLLQPLDHFEPHHSLIAEAIGCPVDSEVFSAKFARYHGIEYRANEMVSVDCDKESGNPLYGKIEQVFIDDQTLVYLLIQVWETLWFEDRYHAYAVREGDEFLCITVNELLDHHPFHLIKSFDEHDSLRYIVPRHR
ncbi:uncharacterized protein LOC135486591 [Lineus longissimus]|uniref:uncharacterized protein LOC135486591 n=1 Tax=Lineus longissimus TaxID=88925 RepID=UPI00315DE9DD